MLRTRRTMMMGKMLVTLADVSKHLALLVFMGDTLSFLETEVGFNLSNRA